MKKLKEVKEVTPTNFSMRLYPDLAVRLDAAAAYEQRPKTKLVIDAIEDYLIPSEAQKRFDLLSKDMTNWLESWLKQRINQSLVEVETWVEESMKTVHWMNEAKTAIEKSTYSFGLEVLQLRDENRELKQMLEQMMTLMGVMANGGGGGYQTRQIPNGNQATPPYSNQSTQQTQSTNRGQPYAIPGAND